MWKWISSKESQQNQKPIYPNLSKEQAQEVLNQLNYKTIADLVYKDDNNLNLDVKEAQKNQIQLKTNNYIDTNGVIHFEQEDDQYSWEDEDSYQAAEDIDKQIYEQMYRDMQEELYERESPPPEEEREYFQPIQNNQFNNNDEDDWETDSEHQIQH